MADECIGDVSLTRAIELLAARGDAVKHSTLSRYITKYADALDPRRRGRETIVNFEVLAAHRADNIRLAPPEPSPGQSPLRGRADEAAQNIRAQRLLREVDLAERTGALTPRREVEEAAHAAVNAMRGALALAMNDTADQIGAQLGCESRLVRPHLRAFEKRGFDAFVRALSDYGFIPPGDAPHES